MIELSRGQELALTGPDGQALTRVTMGLGWDGSRNAGFLGTGAPPVDLDATAVQFAAGELFDLAFYNNLRTRDGSVVHQGDNKTGKGTGDDEQVVVDLAGVYAKVDTIVFFVSSYHGHTLEWIANAYVRVLDDDDAEVARLRLTAGVPQTGLVMAKLVRGPDHWTMQALGEGIAATIPTDSLDALRPYL